MSEFQLGQNGLQIDTPRAGDIVTVRLKPCPQVRMDCMSGRTYVEDESKDPNNYRLGEIWKVIATNGGQAVVEQMTGSERSRGERRLWSINTLDWFEASELLAALAASEGTP